MMRSTTSERRRRPLRSVLGALAALAIAVSGLTVGTALAEQTTTQSASAATAAGFDPGYIISDANFYNGSAMSASDVQAFLNSVAPNCQPRSGGPACLKNFVQNMSAIGAVSGRCAAIPGGSKSAATMIAQVGAACGISQKVLLVLLQKEQAIVATNSPTNYMYLHATGFACPDTAPCDPAYFGFGQQVYAAALQFKRYQATPTSWAYQAGRNNSILYNPNAACGRKTVYIQNSATASLYIYTPYTPNAAAMSNLYGTGDSCSAYGNRNFWRMYTDWFGSTTGDGNPYGSVDSVSASGTTVTVKGWATDPDTTGPIRANMYVDGVGAASVDANVTRNDLAGLLGAGNVNHGFSTTLPNITPGNHSVCVYAINQGRGGNVLLQCTSVTVAGNAPIGVFDTVRGGDTSIAISGWAIDQDTTSATQYKVHVDDAGVITATADVRRDDVARAYPGAGSMVGFSKTIQNVAPGNRVVTLWTQDRPGATWVQVAKATATVTAKTTGPTGQTGAVMGAYDAATAGVGTVSVRGWAINPTVYDAVKYKVQVDGAAVASGTANSTRADVQRVYPTWGSDVGLDTTITGIKPGTHKVSVWYQGLPSGAYVNWGTKTVTVAAPAAPKPVMGRFDSATGGKGTIALNGWAIDPDTKNPVRYKIAIDGVGAKEGSANGSRPDVEQVYPGWGPNTGLVRTLTGIGAGTHTVTVYYQDLPTGNFVNWGTKTVTVS